MTPASNVIPMERPAKQGMKAFMFYIDDWKSSRSIQKMDDHEQLAYLHLLMYAASEPDCGIPNNETELAVICGLKLAWFRKTKTRSLQIAIVDENGVQKNDERGKPTFLTSGSKLLAEFSFRPTNEQSPNGRLYNERLYKEHIRYQTLKEERRSSAQASRMRRKSEPVAYTDLTPDLHEAQQMPPQPPTPTLISTSIPPPPSNAPTKVVVADESTIKPDKNDLEVLAEHCRKLKFAPAGRELAGRIKGIFCGAPMAEIIPHLPRFENQQTPGLWETMTRSQLETEAREQSDGSRRRPMNRTERLFAEDEAVHG